MALNRNDDGGLPVLSVRSSREAAYVALEEFRNSGTWLSDVLDRLFRQASLPQRERGLATELTCGVVRRRATLDAILKKLIARPLDQVESPLLTILHLGVYQIAMLDGVPAHASVHETVELTKRLGRLRWSGFVNGVLRGATRLVTSNVQQLPSSRAIPISEGRFRILNEDLLADPSTNPAEYFAAAYSFPRWLADRWMQRMSAEELFRTGAWFNSPGKTFLRPNRLLTTSEELIERWKQEGVQADLVREYIDEGLDRLREAPDVLRGLTVNEEHGDVEGSDTVVPNSSVVPNSGMARNSGSNDAISFDGGTQVERLPGYEEGLFAVQDLSAMRAAKRLAPQPGHRVWDVCAAPGGKTCHLAELMNNEGQIIATDVRPERLQLIEENQRRLGAKIIQTQLIGETGRGLPDGPFDAILVDVPCSNTGVMGKRPEARWRITPDGILELTRIQERLLNDSLKRLSPGGRLVYSTCSIEPEENSELVDKVLSKWPEFTRTEEELFRPGDPTDGGYQALIMRS